MSGKPSDWSTVFDADPSDPTKRRSVFDRLAGSAKKTAEPPKDQKEPPTQLESHVFDESHRQRAEELYERLITGRSLQDQPDPVSKEVAAPKVSAALADPLPPPVASITIEDETQPAAKVGVASSGKHAAPKRESSVFDRLYASKTSKSVKTSEKGEPGASTGKQSETESKKEIKKSDSQALIQTKPKKAFAESERSGKETAKNGRKTKPHGKTNGKSDTDNVETPSSSEEKTGSDNTAGPEKKQHKQNSFYDRLFAGKPGNSTGQEAAKSEEKEPPKKPEPKKHPVRRQPKPKPKPTEPSKVTSRRGQRRQGGSVFDRLYRGVPVHATSTPRGLLMPDSSPTRSKSGDEEEKEAADNDEKARSRSKSPVKKSTSNLRLADVALATAAANETRLHPVMRSVGKHEKVRRIFGIPVSFGFLMGRSSEVKEEEEEHYARKVQPSLDPSMVNTTSIARGAIPVLPRVAAYACLVLNIIVPGFGTVISGLLVHCMGSTRFATVTSTENRWASTCTNFVVGLMQLYTLTFCLVGWFWSIGWGVIMVSVSEQHRALQGMSEEERTAQGRRTSFQQLIGDD